MATTRTSEKISFRERREHLSGRILKQKLNKLRKGLKLKFHLLVSSTISINTLKLKKKRQIQLQTRKLLKLKIKPK